MAMEKMMSRPETKNMTADQSSGKSLMTKFAIAVVKIAAFANHKIAR